MHALSYYLWPLLLYCIFSHYLINGTILEKKKLLNVKCMFDFPYKVFRKHFSFLEEMRDICWKTYNGLRVKCMLQFWDCNESWIFSSNFRKILNNEISWKCVQWERGFSMRTDGRTDGQTLRSSQSLFAMLRTCPKCVLFFMWSIRYSCPIVVKLEFSGQVFEIYPNIKQ